MAEEFIEEILTMLPVRSLVRFKCVSKSWNSLISASGFKRKHLNFHSNKDDSQRLLVRLKHPKNMSVAMFSSALSLATLFRVTRKFDWSLKFKADRHATILCSCDGLFLLHIRTGLAPPKLVLWNPSTKEFMPLPHIEFLNKKGAFGLGYDSTTDDYKVVRMGIDFDDDDPLVNNVLSLKTGSWRIIECEIDSYIDKEDHLTFLHGSFHGFGEFNGKHAVVSLNISTERYGCLPLPHEWLKIIRAAPILTETGMSVLGGMLCAYINDTRGKRTTYVWVMKDYGVGESWTQVFTILNNGALLTPLYRFSDGEVLFNATNSINAHEYLITDGPSKLRPLVFADRKFGRSICQGFVYSENLTSPKLGH